MPKITHKTSGLHWSVEGDFPNNIHNNSKIHLWSEPQPKNTPNQDFEFVDSHIRMVKLPHMVLVVRGDYNGGKNIRKGAEVHLKNINEMQEKNRPNSEWVMDDDGRIKPKHNQAYCIVVKGDCPGNGKNGNPIHLWEISSMNAKNLTNAIWSDDIQVDELVSVTFHQNRWHTWSQRPVCATEVTASNGTSVTQSPSETVTKSFVASESLNHTVGFKYCVKSTCKAEVPFVGSTELQISTEFSSSNTMGTVKTRTSAVAMALTASAPPGKVVTAKGMFNETKADLPYTMTFASGRTVEGVYRGCMMTDMTVEFMERDLSPSLN